MTGDTPDPDASRYPAEIPTVREQVEMFGVGPDLEAVLGAFGTMRAAGKVVDPTAHRPRLEDRYEGSVRERMEADTVLAEGDVDRITIAAERGRDHPETITP